jgi:hypothetical protein
VAQTLSLMSALLGQVIRTAPMPRLEHFHGQNHLHYLKLNYMHNNPVKRGSVAWPGGWPWSRRGGEILLR